MDLGHDVPDDREAGADAGGTLARTDLVETGAAAKPDAARGNPALRTGREHAARSTNGVIGVQIGVERHDEGFGPSCPEQVTVVGHTEADMPSQADFREAVPGGVDQRFCEVSCNEAEADGSHDTQKAGVGVEAMLRRLDSGAFHGCVHVLERGTSVQTR